MVTDLNDFVAIACRLTGTSIQVDVPLMSAGFDSISAADLSTSLSTHLEVELPSTLLFDHPSLRAIADTYIDT